MVKKTEIPFNLNDKIKFKPNENGIAIMKRKHYPKEGVWPDKDGYSTLQLWQFANTFGGHFIMGLDIPVEMDVTFIQEEWLPEVKDEVSVPNP